MFSALSYPATLALKTEKGHPRNARCCQQNLWRPRVPEGAGGSPKPCGLEEGLRVAVQPWTGRDWGQPTTGASEEEASRREFL